MFSPYSPGSPLISEDNDGSGEAELLLKNAISFFIDGPVDFFLLVGAIVADDTGRYVGTQVNRELQALLVF